MEEFEYVVPEQQNNERIDKIVTPLGEDWSRTAVQNWIKEGLVTVNGKRVKPNYKCQTGDVIFITVPEPVPLEVVPEKMDLDIYYEDQDLIVINKPRGLVVHPAPGHERGTLVNGILYHCKDLSGINGVIRPGIVHRLDKDTTGLLVVAKNDRAHEKLAEQFQNQTVVRKYIAIVHGEIPESHGTIEAPIGRDPRDRKKMAVTEKGKPALTFFRVLERFPGYTLVECRLETGRTHQIRVHMKFIGYPVAADSQYGPKKTLDLSGQALHAQTLGFNHPRTGEYMEFQAPPPADFIEALEKLRQLKQL
ncbi:MAG: RluA family pseudouridine synthase [Caldibacillus sp.]